MQTNWAASRRRLVYLAVVCNIGVSAGGDDDGGSRSSGFDGRQARHSQHRAHSCRATSRPILDGDTIVAVDGRIAQVGAAKDCDTDNADRIVDAHGTTVVPGLIDSHVHPVLGDWTPRQNQFGWIDSFLNGGVTTMISAGEVHVPGRPRDIVGLKAMAIFAQRAFQNLRPGGVKVHAGAPVIEKGMVEQDFKDMADAGVKLLGEVGLGGVKSGEEAKQMVAWARKYGIQSTIHTGGPSIPGSGLIDADVVLEADADIIGHINGGHTSLPQNQVRCLCESCARHRDRPQRQREDGAVSPCARPSSWASRSG
jgi:enamidase